MRVLVTGASGFIGSHVIGALIKAGYLVRGLTRKMPSQERERLGAEYIDGIDVTALSSMPPQIFDDVDAIIHLVGIIRQAAGSQTFEWIHVEGTQNVLDAANVGGFTGRFVYLSALGAAANAPSEYSRTKFKAENSVQEGRNPFTIFRPSLVIGRNSEFVQQMRDLVLHGGLPLPIPMPFIPIPGDGETRFQPLAVGDLVGCVVKCLEMDDAAYQTYELGGATTLTFNEMVDGFAARLGVSKKRFHASLPALGAVAAVMETFLPKPPITRDQLINLGRDNVTNSRAIEEVFKIRPLTFDETLNLIFPESAA